MPAPKDSFACMSRSLARDWWKMAERLAGLAPKRGRGWHSLRRRFASDLMDLPLKVLGRMEDRSDGPPVLPEARRGPAQERLSRSTERPVSGPIKPEQFAGIASPKSRKSLWAWVDLNHRPHAYQVSPRWRESRQEIV